MKEYGYQELEALDIIFRRTQPEVVLDRIRSKDTVGPLCLFDGDEGPFGFDLFDHYARLGLWDFSFDESRQVYRGLLQRLDGLYQERKKKISGKPAAETYQGRSLYDLLWDYGDTVLFQAVGEHGHKIPVCKMEKVLEWRKVSLKLSQDLIICAWLAHHCSVGGQPDLDWQPCILTDYDALNELLKRGIAENHFHLHGSTQNFALNWACLMNRPIFTEKAFASTSLFRDNLDVNILRNPRDHMDPWPARLCRAAMLRGLLFGRLTGLLDEKEFAVRFWLYDTDPMARRAQDLAESLSEMYGTAFLQPDGRKSYLDYAVSDRLCRIDQDTMKSSVRLLIGERAFLFSCFRCLENGTFNALERMVFHTYILLRNAFRSEIIQVNDRPGFRNFAYYQNRKSIFIDGHNDYYAETMRLSVARGIREENIVSLESRITPKLSREEMRGSYKEMDKYLKMALINTPYPYLLIDPSELDRCRRDFDRSFYVVHFPKTPETKQDIDCCEKESLPRNGSLRQKNETWALVLRECLSDPEDRARILGIDACTFEIGCRPEIYGTEMRFLREAYKAQGENLRKAGFCPDFGAADDELGLTYHVGEDFLDLADGLRAVDEAVHFLHMKKGDRIGHGLVLGVDPKRYYKRKHSYMHLHAQDRLDDLVWILTRGKLFLEAHGMTRGTKILKENRNALLKEAGRLYRGIYDSSSFRGEFWLRTYYRSWKLRGDHPALYQSGSYYSDPSLRADPCYMDSMINPNMDSLKIIRRGKGFEASAGLCFRYHYDYEARRKGFEDCCFKAEDWYVDLMGELQKAMQREITSHGILIETNPSSNVLIGTFRGYMDHPLFTFRPPVGGSASDTMDISINTDDIGVFDTTLSFEYALVLQAARSRGWNDADILPWLEELRQIGIQMSFRSAGKRRTRKEKTAGSFHPIRFSGEA